MLYKTHWHVSPLPADATRAGRGHVRAEVMFGNSDMSQYLQLREDQSGFYKLNFSPPNPGLYKVHLFFNDVEIRGRTLLGYENCIKLLRHGTVYSK